MKRPLTGARVFAWIAGFFAAVTAVNGAFVYFAIQSATGLTTANAYNEGIAYNRTLEDIAAQSRLGWRAEIGWRDGAAEVLLHDRDGRPLDGLDVTARFVRPVQEGFDRAAALVPSGTGRYAAAVALPLPGQWDMVIEASRAEKRFRAAARVIVP